MSLIKMFSVFACMLMIHTGYTNTHEVSLSSPQIDLHDKASLQRGARIYMNYCSGCHSLRYMRYNRMAKDLGITGFEGGIYKKLLVSNLIFTSARPEDPIEISMPATDARQWFGVEPPDLSLSARKRGADWLYTYLQSFYEDSTRPFHTNNLLIPNVAMPNVLAPLSGRIIAVTENHGDKNASIMHLQRLSGGSMTEYQFESALQDLVNFLVYVGEPAKMVRYHAGVPVILFLMILSWFVWRLKKNYWKKIKT